jgi:hypothetical protein
MPQNNPRIETHRTENFRNENARSERPRNEKAAMSDAMNISMGDMGAGGVNAGLRIQKQMFDVFEDIGRDWFARATSKAELAFKVRKKLTEAGSVPAALSAYQEWFGEWMNMVGEDSRRLVSDGQKIMDAGVRCFADAPRLGTS